MGIWNFLFGSSEPPATVPCDPTGIWQDLDNMGSYAMGSHEHMQAAAITATHTSPFWGDGTFDGSFATEPLAVATIDPYYNDRGDTDCEGGYSPLGW